MTQPTPGQQQAIDQILTGGTAGFDTILGLEYTAVTADGVEATLTLRPELHQPFGITHGGVYCAIVESVASVSGVVWLGGAGYVVGVNNNTDFLRALSSGVLSIRSTPIHRGRRQQLWLVEIDSEDGKAVARGQVRLQNIDA
ncbi:PaaI family thioesterase [Tsukamurella tyrosinosolvens]|uniref:PaaI family thioesterase n=1 Tax=Tsukamurella tyrosinosolvens TaxID=57704 RepID=UPI0009EF6673|nr:PaaI family thioesterase [Tsukamurella tyrosinosolvens]MCA4993144.1 PaaI family thioesterase [Tsukamurella tyrosinosolvens]WEL91628.1 PaaI family thioesterase [Tsukamurella tyrosinosolvens]